MACTRVSLNGKLAIDFRIKTKKHQCHIIYSEAKFSLLLEKLLWATKWYVCVILLDAFYFVTSFQEYI